MYSFSRFVGENQMEVVFTNRFGIFRIFVSRMFFSGFILIECASFCTRWGRHRSSMKQRQLMTIQEVMFKVGGVGCNFDRIVFFLSTQNV